jgi:hypothetical protein
MKRTLGKSLSCFGRGRDRQVPSCRHFRVLRASELVSDMSRCNAIGRNRLNSSRGSEFGFECSSKKDIERIKKLRAMPDGSFAQNTIASTYKGKKF